MFSGIFKIVCGGDYVVIHIQLALKIVFIFRQIYICGYLLVYKNVWQVNLQKMRPLAMFLQVKRMLKSAAYPAYPTCFLDEGRQRFMLD